MVPGAGGGQVTHHARDLAARLDLLLESDGHPDYPGAMNGLQVDHRGPVRRIGAAVDASLRTLSDAAERGVNFLIVHHGLFWGGARPLVGATLDRVRLLVESDIAVYSSHLPLDRHPEHGNNVLLARALGLVATEPFASYQGIHVGVAGHTEIRTSELVDRAGRFAAPHGAAVRATLFDAGRQTRHWAICTGAGASSDTLREAHHRGIDTLIVGEGPHHTAVDAPEHGVVVIYAGHYATETTGVSAVAELVASETGLPWEFISAPTGL